MPSADLRKVLQAKIDLFEETAGKCKALAGMKRRLTEDKTTSPEFREKTLQKALEDDQQGYAAMLAATVLGAILDGKSKTEQIARMRQYVLEYSKYASRFAKAFSTLADDYPQKQEVEQDGLAAAYVVAVLNSILSDIGPSSSSDVQSSMAGRHGQVLGWTANIIAIVVIAMSVAVAAGGERSLQLMIVGSGVVLAAAVWAIGRGLKTPLIA